tara:strand:+ start:1797 stop:2852 length:1056 start_codon:yes stop_codon:yes gene_type:complete
MRFSDSFTFGEKVFFIADIGSNHDGSLERAIKLVHLAAEAGADAVKLQHFKANTILSKEAFDQLPTKAHQTKWKKSVYKTYEDASTPTSWTKQIAKACQEAKVLFSTSPYSIELSNELEEYVDFFKIGSGDISWLDLIRHVSNKPKPIVIATGASSLEEVKDAYYAACENNPEVSLLQCNTNYSGEYSNLHYTNLKVISTYKELFPKAKIGLSDHTEDELSVIGAVALGATIIEKHFTDDNNREGPDHSFAINPQKWKLMVERTRDLEKALGDGNKKIEFNEIDSSIVQKRSLYAIREIQEGSILKISDFHALRPCQKNSISPRSFEGIKSPKSNKTLKKGENLKWEDLTN